MDKDNKLGNYFKNAVNQEVILTLKKEKHTLNEILELYDNDRIDFKFKERFTKCMLILNENVKNCDIKVIDFIIENIFKHRLFLSHNHITTRVSIYLTNQVFKILNFNFIINQNNYNNENKNHTNRTH